MCASGVMQLRGENAGRGKIFSLVNISGEPEASPDVAGELRWAEMQGEIVALVHSHPSGLPWLSEADQAAAGELICRGGWSCRGTVRTSSAVCRISPGGALRHGVTDCYTLFREVYHLAGIEMPDFIVGMTGGVHGQNLYLDNLEATGFTVCRLTEAQPGDRAAVLFWFIGAESCRHLLWRR